MAGTLTSLDDSGIIAIYVSSSITNSTDSAGNTVLRSGQFQWADGTTGTIADYSLQRDTSDAVATEVLEVPEDIAALPDLNGHGNMYSLHQAMVRDDSGQLRSLLEGFAAEQDPVARAAVMEQILYKWTETDSISSVTGVC